MSAPVVGLWDTEWSPAISYTWSGFPKYLPNDFLIEDPRLLCWGFKYLGDTETEVVDERTGRRAMLQKLWDHLDNTDILISFNGQSFDTPKVNSEFLKEGFDPPSPFKHLDLYRQIKSVAKFYSGKLDFMAERIVDERKVDTGGFKLWKDVLANDEDAWQKFREYQAQDVDLLEKIFHEVKGWLKMPMPFTDDLDACHTCGGTNLVKRGFARTNYSVYQRYRCSDCGKWMRSTAREPVTNIRPAL